MKKTNERGFIKLERALAPGLWKVGVNDPTFSDLAGVLTGMKPVTYTDCDTEGLPRLKALCEKLKLKLLLAEEFLDRKGPHFRKVKKMALIGRDVAKLKKAAAAWNKFSPGGDWGLLLGYPSCCVRAYSLWCCDSIRKKPRPDIIGSILRRTKKRSRLDFRLNNIWNYFSRMDFNSPQDCLDYEKFVGFNRELDLPSKHVISWHPCSYDCAESVRKAGVIFSFMKHYAPAFAAELEGRLDRPVIFWDKFRYAFVDGAVSGGMLNYTALLTPRSLLSDKMYRLIACCDSVSAGKAGAGFYRNGKLVLSTPKPGPVLLDFA